MELSEFKIDKTEEHIAYDLSKITLHMICQKLKVDKIEGIQNVHYMSYYVLVASILHMAN